MKTTVGKLKRLVTEALGGQTSTFTFKVYGPDDQEYTCTASHHASRPFDVEVWQATDSAGNDVPVEELEAMGIDLEEKAHEELRNQGDDGIGRDYDDFHGKSGIDY
jgi:hypothetical protein